MMALSEFGCASYASTVSDALITSPWLFNPDLMGVYIYIYNEDMICVGSD